MVPRGEVTIRTGRAEFDGLYPLVRSFLEHDRLDLSIDGERIRGYRTRAMLWALVEGLAGVVDCGCGFDRATLSPRWPAAGVAEAEVSVGYAASGQGLAYHVRYGGDTVALTLEADRSDVRCHVLLPSGRQPRDVTVNGEIVPFRVGRVEDSRYVDFELRVNGGAEAVIRS